MQVRIAANHRKVIQGHYFGSNVSCGFVFLFVYVAKLICAMLRPFDEVVGICVGKALSFKATEFSEGDWQDGSNETVGASHRIEKARVVRSLLLFAFPCSISKGRLL